MARERITYSCSGCSYKTVKWIGCCPECNAWDSFVEQKPAGPLRSGASKGGSASAATLTNLAEIPSEEMDRIFSGIGEWDRVMGGGIMPSSLLVLTGDPGIGKSTLLLQVCQRFSHSHKICYFSTEESLQQVKQRADRLKEQSKTLLFSDQADLECILQTTVEQKPDIIVVDSVQNCFVRNSQTLPGSVGQLREITFQLMRLAKESRITVIITGHITKEGIIAGPKTLEHMVDAVFYLQGEDRWQTRMLRAVKNRFGPINELGFFQMEQHGLQEVQDINKELLRELSFAPGSSLVSVMEGSRPLLLEIQALTITSKLSMPQRVVSGLDHKQVVLIAAILEKYLQVKLSSQDIFFKVSGGITIKGSSADLAIACALLSSYFKQSLPKQSIILGELSLTGQIKPINQIAQHVKEGQKFGIKELLVAKNQKLEAPDCRVRSFGHVYELLGLFEAAS